MGEKVSRELKSFDGLIHHYANWRNRIRDHFITTNVHYGEVFDIVERTKVPLTLIVLSNAKLPTLPHLNWRWVASHIWTFIGKWMNDTQLERRLTLAGGEEFNGIELWRSWFVENIGGSIEMQKNERAYFINFPKCTRDEDLQAHLNQWKQLSLKYGVGRPHCTKIASAD